jgi:RNA polymerase sigma factor (sigma-70 family)
MKNYRDSDYAANKHAEGIVYRFADGSRFTVTLAAYLAENHGKTEADFAALKRLSDNDYLARDRNAYRQSRKNVPLDGVDTTENCAVPSPETAVIDAPDEADRRRERIALAKKAMDKLTPVQRRRYLMYHVKGLSLRQIAETEGVLHSKIQNSLEAAEKKIKKILATG